MARIKGKLRFAIYEDVKNGYAATGLTDAQFARALSTKYKIHVDLAIIGRIRRTLGIPSRQETSKSAGELILNQPQIRAEKLASEAQVRAERLATLKARQEQISESRKALAQRMAEKVVNLDSRPKGKVDEWEESVDQRIDGLEAQVRSLYMSLQSLESIARVQRRVEDK